MDRATKALLAAIALGLWVNAFGTWFLPPVGVSAQQELEEAIETVQSDVAAIRIHVAALVSGFCTNRRICDHAAAATAIESLAPESLGR